MPTPEQLAEQFEAHRPHVRAVAYRMLGSVSEAEDAAQEAWIRLSRTDVIARSSPHASSRAARAGGSRAEAPTSGADLRQQRRVVDAFLAAAEGGDFDALVAVLIPRSCCELTAER
jgi:RNA polymerase sigma-70 factor (ECF subfamily)